MSAETLKRLRRRATEAADRLGQRERATDLYGRLSLSRRVRRDHLDMRLLQTVIATTVGTGGFGVDVGANVGSVSRMMVRAAPASGHLLIEPVAELADRLRVEFPNCDVVAAVCGDSSGDAEFNVAVNQPTRSSRFDSLASSGGSIERRIVPQIRLDDRVGERDPALVKIDVEGGELAVLNGAKAVLIRARPLVVFEHQWAGPVAEDSSRAIHELLTQVGYAIFDIDGRAPLDVEGFVATVQHARLWTFLGVPER